MFVFVSTCFVCLSKTHLFKFDETDTNMVLMGKSCMYCTQLAESTVHMIKDQRVAVNATQCPLHNKWSSVCFVLLANTCLVVAAVHQPLKKGL